MEIVHEPTDDTAPTAETTAPANELEASATPTVTAPTTEQPTAWPPPATPNQRTNLDRALLIALLVGAVWLDSYELLTLVADLGVVLGTTLRYIAIPFQALYFVIFLFLCWREKIPAAQRRIINAIRVVLTILEGFEFFANFVPIIGGLLEVLPLKTITVVVLFYLRPIAERLSARVPIVNKLIHAAVEKNSPPKL